MCGDTYESLIWNDTTEPKPTQEHLETLWNDVLKENMRQERNQLFKVVILSFIGLSKYK